jgi:PRC-barrel domain
MSGEDRADDKHTTRRAIIFASAAMIGIALLPSGAAAQGAPQTIQIAKVDVTSLAAGYRGSKVIGSRVVNDTDETIGKIDDILVSSDGKQPYAVLPIGGFLGMGSHLVVVPYDALKFSANKVALPGGTKDELKMLPEFKYATN